MKTTLTIRLARLVAGVLIASSVMPAQAGMIGTEQFASPAQAQPAAAPRAALEDKLVSLGVDRTDARDRVAALTDSQAAQVLAQADQLPAGAGVLEIIGLIVVILIVTDLLGITDVFPFINSVAK
jgi:hypothetical protein